MNPGSTGASGSTAAKGRYPLTEARQSGDAPVRPTSATGGGGYSAVARRGPLLAAAAFLALHALVPRMMGTRAVATSFVFLTLAPALAAVAALWRCRLSGFQPMRGWILAAAAMLLWAAGMAASARQDLFLGNPSPAPADSVFLFILYGVPLTWSIASIWNNGEALSVRAIDAVLAATLGVLYFVHSFTLASLDDNPSDDQMAMLIWMFDAENIFLCAGLLMRWHGAASRSERTFFGVAGAYAIVYLGASAWNNHSSSLRGDDGLGTPVDLLMSLPFVVFATLCLLAPTGDGPIVTSSRRRILFVRSASPLFLALALLVVSLFVVRTSYGAGVAGVLVAVLGYGLRTMLGEVRHIEAADGLRDERRSLEALALSDGLTGVRNRRAFDAAFAQEWRARRGSRSNCGPRCRRCASTTPAARTRSSP